MVLVFPGSLLMRAKFLRSKRMLRSDDFPTFERPETATSAQGDFGNREGSRVEQAIARLRIFKG